MNDQQIGWIQNQLIVILRDFYGTSEEALTIGDELKRELEETTLDSQGLEKVFFNKNFEVSGTPPIFQINKDGVYPGEDISNYLLDKYNQLSLEAHLQLENPAKILEIEKVKNRLIEWVRDQQDQQEPATVIVLSQKLLILMGKSDDVTTVFQNQGIHIERTTIPHEIQLVQSSEQQEGKEILDGNEFLKYFQEQEKIETTETIASLELRLPSPIPVAAEERIIELPEIWKSIQEQLKQNGFTLDLQKTKARGRDQSSKTLDQVSEPDSVIFYDFFYKKGTDIDIGQTRLFQQPTEKIPAGRCIMTPTSDQNAADLIHATIITLYSMGYTRIDLQRIRETQTVKINNVDVPARIYAMDIAQKRGIHSFMMGDERFDWQKAFQEMAPDQKKLFPALSKQIEEQHPPLPPTKKQQKSIFKLVEEESTKPSP